MKQPYHLHGAGVLRFRGEEFICGEIAQAAKNLFIWREYAYPIKIDSNDQPPIVNKGRTKSFNHASSIMDKVASDMLEKLKATVNIALDSIENKPSSIELSK